MLNKEESCLSSSRTMWRSESTEGAAGWLAQGLRYGTKKNICIKQSSQNTLLVSATISPLVQGACRNFGATPAYNDFSRTCYGLYTSASINAALSQRRPNPSTPFQKTNTMSVLPAETHSALSQLLQGLQAADNNIRSQAEERLSTEWAQSKPDVLLMGLVEQIQMADSPIVRNACLYLLPSLN